MTSVVAFKARVTVVARAVARPRCGYAVGRMTVGRIESRFRTLPGSSFNRIAKTICKHVCGTGTLSGMLRDEIAGCVYFICVAAVGYAYVGYWLYLRAFAQEQPVLSSTIEPSVSILIAARNEGRSVADKIRNLLELDYPVHQLQIIVVSDGSTDDTVAVLKTFPRVEVVVLLQSGGKALALNEGVRCATGELLLMLDVRQRVDKDAIRKLVPPFADGSIGAVSGELLLESADATPAKEALGIYWKIEKAVRLMESRSGSVVGVTGAIYMMRRELYKPLPAGLILDDVLIPMQVVRQGRRVLFQPAACARDRLFDEPGKEFRRKIRTLTGNFQILQQAPWLLTVQNPVLFRYVSHKLLRLVVPLLLVVMLVASVVSTLPVLHLLFALQLLFFCLALVGTILPKTQHWRVIGIPTTFTMLNIAVVVAFYSFVQRKNVWK